MEPRAVSFAEARKAIEPSKYCQNAIPEGCWTGALDCKVWGRPGGGVYPLHCFFTAKEGGRYQLTAFRAGDRSTYGPSDGGLDLSRVPLRSRVRVSVARNRLGRVKWLSAKLVPKTPGEPRQPAAATVRYP